MSGTNKYFLNLHNHIASHDTLGSLEYIYSEYNKLGLNTIVSTEHGTLRHVIEAMGLSKRYGIKTIFGLEPYVINNYNLEDKSVYHITLVAKSLEGYKSLVKINNHQKLNKHTDFETILNNSKGLICLTGCPNSIFQSNSVEYKSLLRRFSEVFGEDLYIEIQVLSNFPEHYKRALELISLTGAKPVVTLDSHFVHKHHAEYHNEFLRASKAYSYDSSENYLATREDVLERARRANIASKQPVYDLELLSMAMDNADSLLGQFEDYSITSKQSLPEIDNSKNILRDLCYTSDRYTPSKDNTSRLEYELDVINKNGFATYFLITRDIIQQAKHVGDGRGSAGGCYVAYLLGITNVNPLEYGLLFERFLNPSRVTYPDIDTDIASSARQDTLKYASDKYSAMQIAAYDRLGLKTVNFYAKKMKMFYGIPEADWKEIHDLEDTDATDTVQFREFCEKYPKYLEFFNIVHSQVKNVSRHAGGIAIVPEELKELIPYESTKAGDVVIAFSEGKSKDLADAGLIKFDFLGLQAVDILKDLETLTGVTAPNPPKGKLPEVQLLHEGRTAGIFQFAGGGIARYTMEVLPETFEDMVAITSIYRKGTLLAGTGDLYKQVRKSGKPRSLYPEVDKILADTDGLIIYQEDVMKLYAWATGKTFAEADFARRTLVKYNPNNPKSVSDLQVLHEEFMQGLKDKSVPQHVSEELWKEIVTHSAYSFNRSHAVCYTYLTWKLLWYKYHHPVEFYTACLNYRDDSEKQHFIFDIISEGYEIALPDINISGDTWSTDGTKVYAPINLPKGIGEVATRNIIANRPYTSVEDFVIKNPKSSVNKRVKKLLYQVGAFDEIIVSNDDLVLLDIDDYDKPDYNTLQTLFPVRFPTKKQFEEINNILTNPKSPKKYKYFAGFVTEVNVTSKGIRVVLQPNSQYFFVGADKKDLFVKGKCIAVALGKGYGYNREVQVKEL